MPRFLAISGQKWEKIGGKFQIFTKIRLREKIANKNAIKTGEAGQLSTPSHLIADSHSLTQPNLTKVEADVTFIGLPFFLQATSVCEVPGTNCFFSLPESREGNVPIIVIYCPKTSIAKFNAQILHLHISPVRLIHSILVVFYSALLLFTRTAYFPLRPCPPLRPSAPSSGRRVKSRGSASSSPTRGSLSRDGRANVQDSQCDAQKWNGVWGNQSS